MIAIERIGYRDPCLAWVPGEARLRDEAALTADWPVPARTRGAFAAIEPHDGRLRVARDPLGIAKLFWGRCGERLVVASLPSHLVSAGVAFRDIRAVPPGFGMCDDSGEPRTRALAPDDLRPAATVEVGEAGRRIRDALDGYLAALARSRPAARAYVCMSGGLDSSGIAALVRAHLRDVVGVSFDLRRNSGRASADRRTAEKLARDLQVPLLTVDVTVSELLEPIDDVLVACADFRDFNVHCALVNWAIARGIDGAAAEDEDAIVVTGDLANELLADYHEETYRGQTHYRLPRIPRPALRDALVRGLDSSHRELGVFGAFDLDCVQPYSAAVDHYLALEPSAFDDEQRKARLDRAIFGEAVPSYVYDRKKSRAQVGDDETGGGVLAACIDRGIDDAWLRDRFAALHGVGDSGDLNRFVRAGRYRAEPPPMVEENHT